MGRLAYGEPFNVAQAMQSRIRSRDNWELYIHDCYWVLAIDGFFEFYYNPQFFMGKILASDMPAEALRNIRESCAHLKDADRKDSWKEYSPLKPAFPMNIPEWSEANLRTGNLFYAMGTWHLTVNGIVYSEDPYSGNTRSCPVKDMKWHMVQDMMNMAATTITHKYVTGISQLPCFQGMDISRMVRDTQGELCHEKEAVARAALDCVLSTQEWKEIFHRLSESLRRHGRERDRQDIRKLRKDIYSQTLHCVQYGSYLSESGVRVHLPDPWRLKGDSVHYSREIHLSEQPGEVYTTTIRAENRDCLEVAEDLMRQGHRPAVLNMASRRNPGGGVRDGAGAQEENLFRRTNLLLSLYQFAPYAGEYGLLTAFPQYPMDRNFGGIYSPDVAVFRGSETEGYPFLDNPYLVSVISVAAMNRPELDSSGRIAGYLVPGVKNKIRTILRIGILHGHDCLVLGAFGCGAFRNPPRHMARLFREVLSEPEFRSRFANIVFAILEDHNSVRKDSPEGNFLPFAEEFGTV